MSRGNGKCDAVGYDSRDTEVMEQGDVPTPWRCEKGHGHAGGHGMPYTGGLYKFATGRDLNDIAWFDIPTEVTT